MASLSTKALVFAGFGLLVHAAYAVANCKLHSRLKATCVVFSSISEYPMAHADRDLLKLQQEEYTQPPPSIVLELLASFGVLVIGVCRRSSRFTLLTAPGDAVASSHLTNTVI